MPTLRSSRSLRALLIFALACGLATFGCIRPPKPIPKTSAALAVVLDLSTSASNAPSNRCDELATRIRSTLSIRGVRRLDVLALGTGDAGTMLEPIILVPWTRFEPAVQLYEKPGRAGAERDAWIDSVRARCAENVRTTAASPVYAALARGVDSLRARCAEIERLGGRCEPVMLAAHSDMRENAERSIAKELRAVTRGRPANARTTTAIPTLDLSGIDLSVCGVSDTRTAGEEYVAPAALRATWSRVFGGDVAFDAACPSEVRR